MALSFISKVLSVFRVPFLFNFIIKIILQQLISFQIAANHVAPCPSDVCSVLVVLINIHNVNEGKAAIGY